MQIGIGQVRAFITVAATRNFTRASEVLGLSQPALTTRVQQLEEDLGFRLFVRNARTVDLTSTGRELLPHFRRLLNEFEMTIGDARRFASGKHGLVRIACLPSCAATLLPDWIVRFRQEAGDSPFYVRDQVNSRIAAMVRENDVDFGIAVASGDQVDLDCEELLSDQLCAVFPPSHPLASAEQITVAELAPYPLILTTQGSSVREAFERGFAAVGAAFSPVCEATYMSTSVAMVKAGLGVGVLPSTAVELRDAAILSRPIEHPAFERHVVLLRRRNAVLPPAAQRFIEIIRSSTAAPEDRPA